MFLTLHDVHTYYGRSHILQGIDLEIAQGELVILIGRNGVGKTTTLKTIMGIEPARSGRIMLDGTDITALKPYEIAARGIAYVPEERRIIPNLSVMENLKLAMLVRGKLSQSEVDESLDQIFSNFPNLKNRLDNRGDALSGGEQQMLALARAMVAKPKLILIDEPSEGVMPILVNEIGEILKRFLDNGVTILLVEQNYDMAFGLRDNSRIYIMEKGKICHECGIQNLLADRDPLVKYCGIQL
jgi:branched-chain amino acid transport system ATP-binding protein